MELSFSAPISRSEVSLASRLFAVLHAIHLPAFAAALVTGVLLFSPTLRALLLSGYSESIRGMHRWFGRGQIVLALAVATVWIRGCCGSEIDANGPWRTWRVAHLWFVAGAAIGFAATGIVMSSPSSYSLSVVDYSFSTHLWLTYLSCAAIIVHAFLVLSHPHQRRLIRSRTDEEATGSRAAGQIVKL